MSDNPFESTITTVTAPEPGRAEAVIETSPVTEKDIQQSREDIIIRLDMCYQNLNNHMAFYQSEWKDNPPLAIMNALTGGVIDGGSMWADHTGDLFEKETWTTLWESTKSLAGTVYDTAAANAADTYVLVKDRVNAGTERIETLLENPEDTLLNPSWLSDEMGELRKEAWEEIDEFIDHRKEDIKYVADVVKELGEDAQLIIKHRQKILSLPDYIQTGNIDALESFFDNELREIDPEMADMIKNNPDYYAILAVIRDHDTALSYLAYVSLMNEAIPPNFYVYIGGKTATYLAIELLLMAILAFFTAGVGVAARIGTIIARLSAISAKASKVDKAADKLRSAIQAFIRLYEDLLAACKELMQLGKKIHVARNKGLQVIGSTGGKLTLKKKEIKRKKGECQICHQTDHPTPSYQMGVIEYD